MKKLLGLLVIMLISATSFAQFAAGTITRRDSAAYSKPLGYRIGFHTDNLTYSWDKTRYKRVANENYKVWTGLVTQSSTSAPTATIIDTTTFGAITWSRDSVGSYKATATGLFTLNKTVVFHAGPILVSNVTTAINILEKTVNFVRFSTTRTDTGAKVDAVLSGTPFEFRVYTSP
jgi:hypothetical protein